MLLKVWKCKGFWAARPLILSPLVLGRLAAIEGAEGVETLFAGISRVTEVQLGDGEGAGGGDSAA